MSAVDDVDSFEGWGYGWASHGGRFVLEWLPHAERWVRHYRPGNTGPWSTLEEAELRGLGVTLDHPETRDEARRIAEAHARGGRP